MELPANAFELLASHPAAELLSADTLFAGHAAPAMPEDASVSSSRAARLPTEDVTVVITSCGRYDLLEQTIDSFLRYNTYPIDKFIVMEDGDAHPSPLVEKYRLHPFEWLTTGKRVGQIAAIDRAYQEVKTEFIFHCEDDWEFFEPSFIENP